MKFANMLAGVLFVAMATTAMADGAPEEDAAPPPAPAAPEPAAEAAPAPQEAPAVEATAAPAEEAPAEEPSKKFYAGLGLDILKTDVGSDDAILTGANLRLGYFVLPWLAIEGQVFDGFLKGDLDRVAGTEADLGTSYGVFLKPHHTLGPLDLFLSLGYADTKLDVNGPGGGDVGDDGFAYGIGTRIGTSAGAFDFEYANLLDKNDVTVQGLMFSYSRFF